ncbi:hypothetical protein KPL78_27110 [Roseomonas sp. HJA6]|uniref:Uncharacterized protein n=1 Tax=Roseomonas alba TaxID=2846776 RepID=A0ABS7AHK9_9PROT|nr:DUF6683 family protein [Neoroseomonas alba]MBW6401550.1 hypothetical protein [Neoroseomonas alba]
MPRRLLTAAAALIGLMAAPEFAFAQKGQNPAESRPAVMPFGSVGADGAAAIGAGLRLFPAAAGSPMAPANPAPAPASVPVAPSGAAGPAVKPVAAAARPAQPNLPTTKPAAAGAPAGAPAVLRSPTAFAPDPSITARVRQQVLATALPTSPDPDALRATVNSGRPWQEFDQLLTQHGYDPRDLADVVAAFYLIAWEVATGGDALAQPAGIAAVRGQARQMLATNQAMARLSEAERQATAETLAFHAMAIAARNQDLHNAGGGPQVAAYRTEVANAVAQWQGIDLRRFALMPSGFQER